MALRRNTAPTTPPTVHPKNRNVRASSIGCTPLGSPEGSANASSNSIVREITGPVLRYHSTCLLGERSISCDRMKRQSAGSDGQKRERPLRRACGNPAATLVVDGGSIHASVSIRSQMWCRSNAGAKLTHPFLSFDRWLLRRVMAQAQAKAAAGR
jgi:hypothetical protein